MNVSYRLFYQGAHITNASPTVKLIFLFLVSYPLAAVLKRLPDSKPWIKDVFNIT